jgi:hypothetical protein
MSKVVQLRNVPERLHRELVRRARAQGLTLTEYIRALLEREVAPLRASEVFDRIERRPPVRVGCRAADLVREERAASERP